MTKSDAGIATPENCSDSIGKNKLPSLHPPNTGKKIAIGIIQRKILPKGVQRKYLFTRAITSNFLLYRNILQFQCRLPDKKPRHNRIATCEKHRQSNRNNRNSRAVKSKNHAVYYRHVIYTITSNTKYVIRFSPSPLHKRKLKISK